MRDLLEVITEKENQIAGLKEDIAALKRAAAILEWESPNGTAPQERRAPTPAKQTRHPRPRQKSGPGKYPIAIGDAAERVLMAAGRGLHLDIIHESIQGLGVNPPRQSVDSALRKDPKDRFVLKGKRIYDLKQRGLPLEE